jgi:hypothetical protein
MRSTAVRQPQVQDTHTVTGVAAKAELSASDVSAGDGEVVADARRRDAPAAPRRHWYRVLKDRQVLGGGGLPVRLYAGKEIHDGAYDIRRLRQNGVELQDLGEGTTEGPPEERHPDAMPAS